MPANRSWPWPLLLSHVNHICAGPRRGSSSSCQPLPAFIGHEHWAPAALIRCYIRMIFLGSNWIWFHCTLTNGPSNTPKLAEHVPSHSPWRYLSVIKNRDKCVELEDSQHIREVVFWNESRVLRRESQAQKQNVCTVLVLKILQKSVLASAERRDAEW